MIYTILGSFCSFFGGEGADIPCWLGKKILTISRYKIVLIWTYVIN